MATEATESQLSTLINTMVEEKTFSLDAIKAIGTVRDHAVELERKLKYAYADAENLKRERSQLENKISQYEKDKEAFAKREAAVASRETVMLNLEKGTAVAQAQFSVLDSVFKTIFANRGVRETISKSVPVAVPGSNGCGSFVSNHMETTTADRAET